MHLFIVTGHAVYLLYVQLVVYIYGWRWKGIKSVKRSNMCSKPIDIIRILAGMYNRHCPQGHEHTVLPCWSTNIVNHAMTDHLVHWAALIIRNTNSKKTKFYKSLSFLRGRLNNETAKWLAVMEFPFLLDKTCRPMNIRNTKLVHIDLCLFMLLANGKTRVFILVHIIATVVFRDCRLVKR